LLRRVVSDLGDGQPVILEDTQRFIVLAAETATELSLSDLERVAADNMILLLAAGRAALLGYESPSRPEEPRAFHIPWESVSSAVLRGLADPTVPTVLPSGLEIVPTPKPSELMISLVKRAKLLPAVLVAQLTTTEDLSARHRNYLTVAPAEDLRLQLEEEPRLKRIAEANLPINAHCSTRMIIFRNMDDDTEIAAIVIGDPKSKPAPLVRLHSACFTGEALGSRRCDCGEQLRDALDQMAAEGVGILIYLPQEGRGIGLSNKLRAYHLQDLGYDTLQANHALGWESDARSFAPAAAILKELDIARIRLLSNNSQKLSHLTKRGIAVQSVP
jgi:GTP cyclohydrolase II